MLSVAHVYVASNLSQDSRSASRDLKPVPPEYESGVPLGRDFRVLNQHVIFHSKLNNQFS
jgi:hypothetical protein